MKDIFRDNLVNKIGISGLERIEAARVGVAGAGGLGSNCAANLTRVGFRKFKIVDFDKIDHSNLDRQFYFNDQVGRYKTDALRENLLRISPGIELDMVNERIDRDNAVRLFVECDIVAECLDTAAGKSMLVTELLKAGKPVVSVSGLGGVGSSDDIKVHKIRDGLIIIGDLERDIAKYPALAPRVSLAAAKQADVILEYIVNKAS